MSLLNEFMGLVGALAIAGQVFAQVQVYPMQLSLTARPADLVACSLTVQNTDSQSSLDMSVRVAGLTQMEDGRLALVQQAQEGLVSPGQRSCTDWIGLQTQTIQVGPDQRSTIGFEIRVPPDAKDLYWAGLVLNANNEQRLAAVSIEYRYIVPVLVQVGARRPSRDLRIDDIGLTSGPNGQAQAYITVENTGTTFAQVNANARVISIIGGRQQVLIPRLVFGQAGLLPGARVVLRQDVGQDLVKGTYKVSGSVSVDHRFTERLDRQVGLGTGPQLDQYLTRMAQQTASLTIEPQEGLTDQLAEPRLVLADDGRPMRLMLDQTSGSPLFVGKKDITIRTNIPLDITVEAEALSPAGGIWTPSLSTVFGQPEQVQLQLTGRQIQVNRLTSGAGRVVGLTISCCPRP